MKPRTEETCQRTQEFMIFVCLLCLKLPIRHAPKALTCTELVTSAPIVLHDEPRAYFSTFQSFPTSKGQTTLIKMTFYFSQIFSSFGAFAHTLLSGYKHLDFSVFPVSQGRLSVL